MGRLPRKIPIQVVKLDSRNLTREHMELVYEGMKDNGAQIKSRAYETVFSLNVLPSLETLSLVKVS